jgi:hypothetical protein
MTYRFDINNLDILNHLIFDSSMNPGELKLSEDGTMELTLERMALEEVERTKMLFWNKTKWKGKRSVLKFYGVKNIKVLHTDEDKKDDNHFIDGLVYDPVMALLELITSFGLTVEFDITDQFHCKLTDISSSDFGNGSCFGKVSYTKEEWKAYLKEMDYKTDES